MENYTINIKKSGTNALPERFRIGDNGLRKLCFHFTEGSEPILLSDGCTATLFAVLPDKENTTLFDLCEIEGNSVVYTLKGAASGEYGLTSFAGQVDCEIRIISNSGFAFTSPRFSLFVDNVLQNDEAIEAEPSFSALTETLARINAAESTISAKADRDWVISYIESTFLKGEW